MASMVAVVAMDAVASWPLCSASSLFLTGAVPADRSVDIIWCEALAEKISIFHDQAGKSRPLFVFYKGGKEIARINEAKQQFEAAVETAREDLSRAAVEAELAAGRIDVTLPGRGESRGGIHPVTRARLRIERIFEDDGIKHELDAYNPLIPDGRNFKATMLIEFVDGTTRRSCRT
jgi:hypothetical protein